MQNVLSKRMTFEMFLLPSKSSSDSTLLHTCPFLPRAALYVITSEEDVETGLVYLQINHSVTIIIISALCL